MEKAKEDISIHAPRTGSDRFTSSARITVCRFQSTLPARGATVSSCALRQSASHFNPRSPHGERPSAPIRTARPARFQSTLPARGATTANWRSSMKSTFQSTLPARGATIRRVIADAADVISIHAPRTGSDLRRGDAGAADDSDFNPRSPHGERRNQHPENQQPRFYFNPRSPHGERHRHDEV